MICKNMSVTERLSRVGVSLVLLSVSPVGLDLLPGAVIGWFCVVFGVVNFISAIVGWCFMYSLVGLTTYADQADEGLPENESNSEERIESLSSMKRKTFVGFSVVTLLVSALYILEGYSAAVDFGRKMEFRHLHANTNILTDELEGEIALMKDGKHSGFDEDMLEQELYHFDNPMFVIVNFNGKYTTARKGLPSVDEGEFINFVQSKTTSVAVAGEPDLSKDHAIASGETVSKFLVNIDGQEYGWMHHKISDNFSITTLQMLESSSMALSDVMSRLTISSFVVLWLGLWGAYGVAGFVTIRIKNSNRQIMIAATTDPLTGLLNERALKQAFKALVSQKEQGELRFTLMYYRNYVQVQLDHGNNVANKVLQEAAAQLRKNLPENAVFGRLNDGGFLAISHDKSSASSFWQEANKTINLSDYSFSLDPTAITLDYPQDGETFDTLLKHAAITLQRAFQDRNPVLKFNYKFLESSLKRSKYASQIKSALLNQEFELYFQPKVSLQTRRMVGAEALIRWNHPEDGLLGPAYFLDIIEHSNARHDFSLFVIRKTAQCLQELQRQKLDIRLSFNLNAYDINDTLILSALRESIRDFDIPQGYLQVELTESETSYDIESIIHALNEISGMGCSIAIDDFGTGMSSLEYCHRLPVDTIKLDRSFILRLQECNRSQLMVKTVIEMARIFSWEVVAEGIENHEVAHLLQTLGCEQGQGYYFARPMPFAELCLADITL